VPQIDVRVGFPAASVYRKYQVQQNDPF